MKYSPMEAHFVFCTLSPERGEGKDTCQKLHPVHEKDGNLEMSKSNTLKGEICMCGSIFASHFFNI